jgi:NADH-quinone oxidoreductase subunit I
MNGLGAIRSMGVVARHFIDTYIVDFQHWISGKKQYYTPESIAERSSVNARGIFTIQYPEEKLQIPEEFRYKPFLVYDEGPNGEKILRCTS